MCNFFFKKFLCEHMQNKRYGNNFNYLMRTEHSASLERRIEGALNTVMMLFGVPESLRREKLAKVLAMDYHAIGREVYESFRTFVTESNEHALDEALKNAKIKTYR